MDLLAEVNTPVARLLTAPVASMVELSKEATVPLLLKEPMCMSIRLKAFRTVPSPMSMFGRRLGLTLPKRKLLASHFVPLNCISPLMLKFRSPPAKRELLNCAGLLVDWSTNVTPPNVKSLKL